jgi:hypothetical protein
MAARTSKTTFAKLDRERRLREKREEKRARREARRAEAANPTLTEVEAPEYLDAPVEVDETLDRV